MILDQFQGENARRLNRRYITQAMRCVDKLFLILLIYLGSNLTFEFAAPFLQCGRKCRILVSLVV